MKRGHVTGTKREKPSKGTPWYAVLEEEAIRQVEAAWAEDAKKADQQ